MTTLSDLIEQVRLARPLGTVYMGIYRAAARFMVREGHAYIYGFLGPIGRDFVVVQTRYEDASGLRIPREIVYLCLALENGVESAAHYLYQLAMQVHAICQLSANTGSTIVQETLFTEFPSTPRKHLFRRICFSEVPLYPVGGRTLDKVATLDLGSAIWGHAERTRLLLAISHYQEALRLWREGSGPLVALYLWMAVEALTNSMLRRELNIRQINEEQLMVEFGISGKPPTCETCGTSQTKAPDRRHMKLLAEVRRRLIFEGDDESYKIAAETSNRIEHGYGSFEEIWQVPFAIYEKVARYVRQAIFCLVDVKQDTRTLLESAPYRDVYKPPIPPMRIEYSMSPPSDWIAIDFQPSPSAVQLISDGKEFSINY
jgi:hypothetical protein